MTDNTYEKGMAVRRSVLGDEHVDRAEAGKNEFTEEFQGEIRDLAPSFSSVSYDEVVTLVGIKNIDAKVVL